MDLLSLAGTPANTLAERARKELDFDTSEEDNEENDSESEEEPDIPSPKRQKSKKVDKGAGSGQGPNWQILETIWPASERPAGPLTDRKTVESMSINSLLDI